MSQDANASKTAASTTPTRASIGQKYPSIGEKQQATEKARKKTVTAKKEKVKKDKVTDDKLKKLNKAKSAKIASEHKIENSENTISHKEDVITLNNSAIDDKNEAINDNNVKIKDLKKDGSPAALSEAKALESKNKKLIQESTDLVTKNKSLDSEIKDEKQKIKDEKAKENQLDTDIDTAKSEYDAAKKESDAATNDLEKDENELSKAKEDEDEAFDDVAEKYPNSVGKEIKAMKDAESKAASDKAKSTAKKNAADKAKKDQEDADALYDKHWDEVFVNDKKEPPLADFYDDDAASDCKTPACLNNLLNSAKAARAAQRIKDLKEKLNYASSPEEVDKIMKELGTQKEALSSAEKSLNQGLAAALLGASGSPKVTTDGQVIWDSNKAGVNMPGRLDDLIAKHMQPKYKHAYLGEFPEKLSNLDWMVKSMDRPKIDVEYVEQMRNNVKRNYPIKYSYGDISFTFWDNVEHKTISTLHEYFTGKVWNHAAGVANPGFIMLRDNTIIPQLIVWDLTVDGQNNMKYIFENAALVSFDFDSNEDETDEGVHTIQAVFKFERYDAIPTKGTPPGLAMKTVEWL